MTGHCNKDEKFQCLMTWDASSYTGPLWPNDLTGNCIWKTLLQNIAWLSQFRWYPEVIEIVEMETLYTLTWLCEDSMFHLIHFKPNCQSNCFRIRKSPLTCIQNHCNATTTKVDSTATLRREECTELWSTQVISSLEYLYVDGHNFIILLWILQWELVLEQWLI